MENIAINMLKAIRHKEKNKIKWKTKLVFHIVFNNPVGNC